MYKFEYADSDCFEKLKKNDKHISEEMLYKKIYDKEVIIVKADDKIIQWLRYGCFFSFFTFFY